MSEELNKLYSPSHWNPSKSSEEIIKEFFDTTSKTYSEARKTISGLFDVDYGEHKLDIWGSNASTATHIFVYFHGGYFLAGSKEDAGPLIDLSVNGAGIPLISVGYTYATQISLENVIEQAKKAFEFIQNRYKNAVFTVGGHSAGAFLAASAVSRLEDSRRIKQLVLIDGIYKLAEFAQVEEGKQLKMPSDDSLDIDPHKLSINMHRRRITIFIAEYDSPKFHEQADWLQTSIIEASGNAIECEKLFIHEDDHFSIIQNMKNRSCDPARHLLRRLRFC